MTATSTTLPADWFEFLHAMDRHVKQAIAGVDTRIEHVSAEQSAPRQREHSADTASVSACLDGLGTQLDAAEALVNDIDLVLLTAEQSLRQQEQACANLRQRLADWSGRAIG